MHLHAQVNDASMISQLTTLSRGKTNVLFIKLKNYGIKTICKGKYKLTLNYHSELFLHSQMLLKADSTKGKNENKLKKYISR